MTIIGGGRGGEHLNEQVSPDHGGAGRRKRLVLGCWKHGEDSFAFLLQEPDFDGDESDAEVEDVVEPTVVSPPTDMERRGSTWESFCKFR